MVYNSLLHFSTAEGGPQTFREHLELFGWMLTSSLDSWGGEVCTQREREQVAHVRAGRVMSKALCYSVAEDELSYMQDRNVDTKHVSTPTEHVPVRR